MSWCNMCCVTLKTLCVIFIAVCNLFLPCVFSAELDVRDSNKLLLSGGGLLPSKSLVPLLSTIQKS